MTAPIISFRRQNDIFILSYWMMKSKKKIGASFWKFFHLDKNQETMFQSQECCVSLLLEKRALESRILLISK
jgi:hypothetical protein